MSTFAALGLGGGFLAACGASGASSPSSTRTTVPSAAQAQGLLNGRNPATLAGGNVIVGRSNSQRLLGGPGANTILALGRNETIVGGGGPDQLGAYGANATIIGGRGSAYIYAGGPHATLVSGSAPDQLIDTTANGTIHLKGNGNEVFLSGDNDHVVCMPSSHHDVIYDNTTDSVNSVCRANGVHVGSLKQGPTTIQAGRIAAGLTTASPVQGSGTEDDPYVAECDPNRDSDGNCVVSSFAPRSLSKFLQHDVPPSYKCPADAQYLVNQHYAPSGTTLDPGVEIREDTSDWHINVLITGSGSELSVPENGYAAGITSALFTSATDWDSIFGETHSYQVVLHCTANKNRGYLP